MSTIRLPKVGDSVYLSVSTNPDVEYKYVVTAETDDGYHIVPDGKDPTDNTSLIKYKFLRRKWVVHGAEDTFDVRIQLNPDLYTTDVTYTPMHEEDIERSLLEGDFDTVKDILEQFRNFFDVYLATGHYNWKLEQQQDGYMYYSLIKSPNSENIFEWLKRNYIVNYITYLEVAYAEAYEHNFDPFEWLVAQDYDWSKCDDPGITFDRLFDNVLEGDRDDILAVLMRIPGLISAIEKDTGKTFEKVAEKDGSTKILELIRAVPTKAVQVKHL